MLEQVLLSLRNWFVADKRTGRVRIEDGRLGSFFTYKPMICIII